MAKVKRRNSRSETTADNIRHEGGNSSEAVSSESLAHTETRAHTETPTHTNAENGDMFDSRQFYRTCKIVESDPKMRLWRWLILLIIGALAFGVRLFAVIRFESVIHEFDPYFNFRTTKFLTEEGFMAFWNWFDSASWYPLGRVVGQTLFPGLMTTAWIFHATVNALGFPIEIRDVCVFIAPIFAALTAWSAYGLCKECSNNKSAGLMAALFIAVIPSYMSRSTAGGFDNEAIAIFTLVFSFYTYMRACNQTSLYSVILANLAYFYMVTAWGGYVFVTNIVAIYNIALIFMNAFNERHFIVYTIWYCMGTLWCLNIPFVHFAAVKSSEHMLSHGTLVFALCWKAQDFFMAKYSHGFIKQIIKHAIIGGFLLFQALFALLVFTGRTTWSGRSMTLLDPTYAAKNVPIIASVSEHQPSSWASYHFDLGTPFLLVPAGIWLTLCSKRSSAWFLAIYGVLAAHFASVMVRLMLALAPAAACLSAVALSRIWQHCFENIYHRTRADQVSESAKSILSKNQETDEKSHLRKKLHKEEQDPNKSSNSKSQKLGCETSNIPKKYFSKHIGLVGLCATLFLSYKMIVHGVWSSASVYSSPSIVVSASLRDNTRLILDDFREAYSWMRENTHPDARIMSWWDYGYQAAFMANRTIVVDNNTWNNTHIATVGLVLGSDEETAYPVLQHLDVDYVFVVFGGIAHYSGDDLNKFLWMIRIASGVFDFMPKEADYMSVRGAYDLTAAGSPVLHNSLMYRMSYYGFHDSEYVKGHDHLRNVRPAKVKPFKYLEEAYTTSSWMVRVFRVKKNKERLPYGQRRLRNVLVDPPGLIKAS